MKVFPRFGQQLQQMFRMEYLGGKKIFEEFGSWNGSSFKDEKLAANWHVALYASLHIAACNIHCASTLRLWAESMNRPKQVNNQSELVIYDWLSANQGPVLFDSVGSWGREGEHCRGKLTQRGIASPWITLGPQFHFVHHFLKRRLGPVP
eukprot:sb/3473532/